MSVVQGCPPPDDSCEALRKLIDDLIEKVRPRPRSGMKGLKHRFREQIEGSNGPGTPTWEKHEQEIKTQQKRLRDKLNEHKKNRCGPPPPGAWKWATRPVPQPSDWKNSNSRIGDVAKYVGGGAAALGVGYLIYRGIRMIPSLLPPLWPTIPANLAIP